MALADTESCQFNKLWRLENSGETPVVDVGSGSAILGLDDTLASRAAPGGVASTPSHESLVMQATGTIIKFIEGHMKEIRGKIIRWPPIPDKSEQEGIDAVWGLLQPKVEEFLRDDLRSLGLPAGEDDMLLCSAAVQFQKEVLKWKSHVLRCEQARSSSSDIPVRAPGPLWPMRLVSLSRRVGQHQRTKSPRPTTKTK